MFSGLTKTIGNVTGLPVPDLPVDLPTPISTELIDHDGHLNTPLPLPDLPLPPLNLTSLTSLTSLLSLEGISNFVKNLSWDYVVTLVKGFAAQAGEAVKKFVNDRLEPYKDYIKEHKVLIIYIAIAVGILIIPIVLFLVFAIVVFGLGFVLFLVVAGLVIFVGAIVLVVTLIALVIVLLIVGLIVVAVDAFVKKFKEWLGLDSEESASPEAPNGDAGAAEPEASKDKDQ